MILRAGMKNPAVLSAQNALKSALGPRAANKQNSAYGRGTIHDVRLFRQVKNMPHHGPGTGLFIDEHVWNELVPYMNRTNKLRVRQYQALLKMQAIAHKKAIQRQQGRDGISHEAHWALANPGWLRYRQIRPFASSLRAQSARYRTDCSAFSILSYKAALVPSPNGSYNGYGNTWSLWARGRRTYAPRIGDLAFYGGRNGPTHVAIYIGNGRVISFGHTPVTEYPVHYRGDFMGFRSYLP